MLGHLRDNTNRKDNTHHSLTHTFKQGENDSQMIFGEHVGQKLLDICLTGEEEPRKTTARKLEPWSAA